MINFIYTINPKWTEQTYKTMTDSGIHFYRLNATHIAKDKIVPIVNLIKSLDNENQVFFDLPGTKARIWYRGKNNLKKRITIGEKIHIFFTNEAQSTEILQMTGQEVFRDSSINDCLIVRRHNYSPIRLKVLEKEKDKLKAIALDDGVIGWGYHIYIDSRPIEYHTMSYADTEYISLLNKCKPQCLSVSFADNSLIINDILNHLTYPLVSLYAKIETKFGVLNLEDIVKYVDGLVIARDDLSAYYNDIQIQNISENIISLCDKLQKISIPASNYFSGLCLSPSITSKEFDILLDLQERGIEYIYCNETNKCEDWQRFRKLELTLHKLHQLK